ncbi:MAG: hypothetical protein K2X47_19820 [Bdellovibrionales bacterium]|nr:hypothetical protein [Bdellovibrionales bacterium]
MRTSISVILGTLMLLLSAHSAFAEKPYQTVHQRKNPNSDRAHIQAQANEYFGGQFASENDIVMNPVPSDDEDSQDRE